MAERPLDRILSDMQRQEQQGRETHRIETARKEAGIQALTARYTDLLSDLRSRLVQKRVPTSKITFQRTVLSEKKTGLLKRDTLSYFEDKTFSAGVGWQLHRRTAYPSHRESSGEPELIYMLRETGELVKVVNNSHTYSDSTNDYIMLVGTEQIVRSEASGDRVPVLGVQYGKYPITPDDKFKNFVTYISPIFEKIR